MTNVLAINGSPRKDGNTAVLIRTVLKELEKVGIKTETIQLGGKKIYGCTACMKCFGNRDKKCIIDDDLVNTCIEKMSNADGIIFGSPVYFLDVTSEMKALIDRAGFVSFANGLLFKNKIGNATVAVRRAGASRTADTMLHFFLANEMIVAGLPVIGMGRDIGDVGMDEEGMGRAKNLGETMALLLTHLDRYPLPVQKPAKADERMTKKKK
ncbi:MAG: flavodoxin family protein [Methanoregula sp.]|jgi:multimeric flavodoxin WrbA|uniref:flavodoxin family protein n=1 Tax=Methanoregula sp. TaxID=2052170 RepID=UPI0025EF5D35|nr:flavodoxin family protein [Methanoregula sp.]MCK9631584.1 flavodoxin family protein [Methanoregula sp.]